MMEKALEGLSVVEYCTGISGPYCTKIMADLGADVVKIESPKTGDPARMLPPFPDDQVDPDRSGLFLYLNINKRGVTLDPSTPEGKRVFLKLTEGVDVLVVDKPHGFMERLGLGYEALKVLNPGLIMAVITPFGLDGAYKDYKAYQLNTSHISGQGYLLPIPAQDADRGPVMMGGNNSDYDPGVVVAIAILAAYYWKGISGRGQHIDLSKQEALISMQRVESVTYANDGISITRINSNQGERMIGGVMPCKDGYVVVLTPEEHQWQSLMTLLGNPEWSEEPWCKEPMERFQHAAEVNRWLLEWMKDRTQEEIFRKGQALSCPVAPIQSADRVVNSEHLNTRGFFTEVNYPGLGQMKLPTAPYIFSKSPWEMTRKAPSLGEHNEEIYHSLGYSGEELAVFRDRGAI